MLLKLGIITGLMGCLVLDGDLNVKIAWSFEGDAFLFFLINVLLQILDLKG